MSACVCIWQALDRLLDLIDHGDDTYTSQQALIASDAAFFLVELLSDESDAVALRAARAVTRMCSHSAPAKARLQAGPLLGLESSVSRVLLNPCQSEFVSHGAIAALVPWLCCPLVVKAEAAADAISALTSFFREGQLAYLEALVDALRISAGQPSTVAEALDALVDSMDCSSDEVLTLLLVAVPPLLSSLSAATGEAAATLLCLLATMCERQSALIEALLANCPPGPGSEAVDAVVRHLVQGGAAVQDAAARALWALLKDEPASAVTGAWSQLEGSGQTIAASLQQLIRAADEEELALEDAEEAEDSGGDTAGWAPAAADICYAEDAKRLLKAVVAVLPSVHIDGQDLTPRPTSCVVM